MANFYISHKDWTKLQNFARYAYDEYKSEIGGFLIAEQDEDNKWKMHKPVILKQEISGGNTVIDKDALAQYYVETAMKMKNKPFQFVWWHSHHTMAVFWSATDLTAIDEFSNGQMSISLVINLQEEYKLRVNLWHPYKMHQDVEMDIINKPATKAIPKNIVKEVDELCDKPTYNVIDTTKYKYDGNKWRTFGNYKQLNMFGKDDDPEMTQLEAEVDNVLLDYLTNFDIKEYKVSINKLNNRLTKAKSELRVGLVDKSDEQFLYQAITQFDADFWIHRKDVQWTFLDKCIEGDLDCEDMGAYDVIDYNNSFKGGIDVKSKI